MQCRYSLEYYASSIYEDDILSSGNPKPTNLTNPTTRYRCEYDTLRLPHYSGLTSLEVFISDMDTDHRHFAPGVG